MPILLVTSVGGFVTLIATVWLARRAFQKRRLNIVWFGTACPQAHYQWGLALLRMVDPDLVLPASMSAVLGSGGALLGGAPLMMGIIPMVIGAWPAGYPAQGVTAVGVLAVYMLILVAIWVWLGSLGGDFSPFACGQ